MIGPASGEMTMRSASRRTTGRGVVLGPVDEIRRNAREVVAIRDHRVVEIGQLGRVLHTRDEILSIAVRVLLERERVPGGKRCHRGCSRYDHARRSLLLHSDHGRPPRLLDGVERLSVEGCVSGKREPVLDASEPHRLLNGPLPLEVRPRTLEVVVAKCVSPSCKLL